MYRDEIYSLQILLSTQAGPGRTVKQEQEEISPNHVQRLNLISVEHQSSARKGLAALFHPCPAWEKWDSASRIHKEEEGPLLSSFPSSHLNKILLGRAVRPPSHVWQTPLYDVPDRVARSHKKYWTSQYKRN